MSPNNYKTSISNFSTDSILGGFDSQQNISSNSEKISKINDITWDSQYNNLLESSSSYTTDWQVLDLSAACSTNTYQENVIEKKKKDEKSENDNEILCGKNGNTEKICVDLEIERLRPASTPAANLSGEENVEFFKFEKQHQQRRPSCFNFISTRNSLKQKNNEDFLNKNDSLLKIEPQQNPFLPTEFLKPADSEQQMTPLSNPFTSNAFFSMLQRHSAATVATNKASNIFNNQPPNVAKSFNSRNILGKKNFKQIKNFLQYYKVFK